MPETNIFFFSNSISFYLSFFSLLLRCGSSPISWHSLWSHRTIMSLMKWCFFSKSKNIHEKMLDFIRNEHTHTHKSFILVHSSSHFLLAAFFLLHHIFDSLLCGRLLDFFTQNEKRWTKNYSYIKYLTSISSNEFLIIVFLLAFSFARSLWMGVYRTIV